MRALSWLRFITDPPPTPQGVAKQEDPPTTGVYYDTEWAQRPTARFVRKIGVWGFMKPAIKLYGSPKVIGADRLADVDGPVVFAANHHSHADTTLLLATTPGHLREELVIAAGADYFFPNRVSAAGEGTYRGCGWGLRVFVPVAPSSGLHRRGRLRPASPRAQQTDEDVPVHEGVRLARGIGP